MKSFLLLCALFYTATAMAVCSSPIARTNYAVKHKLTSAEYNSELNTVYSRANELPGDCVTDGTIHGNKLITASVDISKVNLLIAIISEVQSNGTSGGTFASGAWRTRTLNTEVDPGSIVSVSSNRFTLNTGTYLVEASAPGCYVGDHNVRIFNYSSSSSVALGSNNHSEGTACNNATVIGIATVTSTSSFEIQHFGSTDVPALGFGVPNLALTEEEVYTVVKITKIK